MMRLWFKDGSYMDVLQTEVHWYEMDPNLDRIEKIETENGKR